MSSSTVFAWFTSAALVTVISIVVNSIWERRKLNRAERAGAYAAFLEAYSRRWRAFNDRDGAAKAEDESALQEAEVRVDATRDDLYGAYTQIQILGSESSVQLALKCMRISDQRNRSFKKPAEYKGVGSDIKADALATFVAAARRDLGLKTLDREALRALSRDSAREGKRVAPVLGPTDQAPVPPA